MSNDNFNFNFTLDSGFKKICTNSTLDQAILLKKRANFQDLAKLLDEAIKEAESANFKHNLARKFELVARVISVVSKASLMILTAKGLAAAAAGTSTVMGLQASSSIAITGTGAVIDSTDIIVKAINEELRAQDAAERYAKNKITLAENMAKRSASETAKKVTGGISLLWDVIDIGRTITTHINEYQEGGNLNIDTSLMKKQIQIFKQKIIEIDKELFSQYACNVGALA